MTPAQAAPASALPLDEPLPQPFAGWFAARGWRAHAHQLAMLAAAEAGHSALLVAPTGGGKTLAGFLPSLVALAPAPRPGLHTLYVSPLKALAVDVHRNLMQPIAEMGLEIACETRSGDTPHGKKLRQRRTPPQILLTTPESLALLLSYYDAPQLFAGLERIVIDELHALYGNKRGDLLALGLSRLATLAPNARRAALSATVREPALLLDWLAADPAEPPRLVTGAAGAKPQIEILATEAYLPWSGHMAVHALPEVYQRIRKAGTTLVFVNTRAQAEVVFQGLWHLNDDRLAIGLHHGSLDAMQRRKVEAAMARGELRAVVATSSLDLGIDWAAVDLVIQLGAPKGAARLVQRIGRANHRLDRPSRALLVPGNRFETLECRAALEAVEAHDLDGDPERIGGLDVLAQHILGRAASGPFEAGQLYEEVRNAQPYRALDRPTFDEVVDFVATGGYALKSYERYRRIVRAADGSYRIAGPLHARRYRMNVGTIVEQPVMKVRLGMRVLGEVEEYFIQGLTPGDTFVFAGQLLRFERLREDAAEVSRAKGGEPQIPAYAGGRLPLTTALAERVRRLLENPRAWRALPAPVQEWLRLQRWRSILPPADGLLVETFPRGARHYLVAYCFEGRNAHQTLGMLLTRRMERAGLSPLGFVATDYVLGAWSLKPATDIPALFDQDMLGEDLEEWMADSSMLRRTFRQVAVIAGLIEQRRPGADVRRRQVSFNADLIYDVLRKHQPDHLLLRATRADAAGGLTDIRRLADMLARVRGKIRHRALEQVSPLAVPVLLEIGREEVFGSALDELLDEGARALIAEATAFPGIEQAELPL